jgi:hypothetical protein
VVGGSSSAACKGFEFRQGIEPWYGLQTAYQNHKETPQPALIATLCATITHITASFASGAPTQARIPPRIPADAMAVSHRLVWQVGARRMLMSGLSYCSSLPVVRLLEVPSLRKPSRSASSVYIRACLEAALSRRLTKPQLRRAWPSRCSAHRFHESPTRARRDDVAKLKHKHDGGP